jgi:hypothetical protein
VTEHAWRYLEHLSHHVPTWFIALGGVGALVLSHLEDGVLRAATSIAALTLIATACYRVWKLLGKLIRRTDSIDEVVEVHVPKLIEDVAKLHNGQEEMRRSLRNIEDRSRHRREEDYRVDE